MFKVYRLSSSGKINSNKESSNKVTVFLHIRSTEITEITCDLLKLLAESLTTGELI